jgi:hypothetical protein
MVKSLKSLQFAAVQFGHQIGADCHREFDGDEDSFGPGPFDPIEAWEHWLGEVREMPDSFLKDYAMEKATRVISEIKLHLPRGAMGYLGCTKRSHR